MGADGLVTDLSHKRSGGVAQISLTDDDQRGAKKSRLTDANSSELISLIKVAVDQSTCVSDTGKEMLNQVADCCLSTPANDRHDFQIAIGHMFSDVLGSIANRGRHAVIEAGAFLDKASIDKNTRQQELCHLQLAVASCRERVQDAAIEFANDSVALEAARLHFDKAAEERKKLDCRWLEAPELKAKIEAALSEHYNPLLERAGGENDQNLTAFQSLFARVPIEDSLVRAFTAAAKLKPPARGNFDRWALDQLRAELVKHANALGELAASTPEGAIQRAEAVASAEACLATAQQRQSLSALRLRAAEIEEWEAEGAVDAAHEEVRMAQETCDLATASFEAEELAFNEFQIGPITALEVLGAVRSEEVAQAGFPTRSAQETTADIPVGSVCLHPSDPIAPQARESMTPRGVAHSVVRDDCFSGAAAKGVVDGLSVMAGVPTPVRATSA
mmetsp:Transcript_113262/g.283688  ORF Transcript_113262/g.283688 Transcript_113262/m.283688 type:complete len:447 (+) Transcript_113262:63-1403(+)